MTKQIKVILVAIAVILVAWGISSYQKNKKLVDEPIRIGVSTILSSQWAALGENIIRSAELTVDGVNQHGGIDGRSVQLVIQDAGLDGKAGLAAAQKLINTDKVKYIIGGTSGNGTMASAPLANETKTPYLTTVTGGNNIDNAGEYIFRIANADVLAGRDIANAMAKLGYTKVGVISEVTEYTADIAKSFVEQVQKNGGQVVVSEEFQPDTSDFRTSITKIKVANPEAILVASQTGVGGALFLKQSHEQNLILPTFSDFTFVTNEDAKKIIGSFEGIYFADPGYDMENQQYKDFVSAYENKFGSAPLIPFHSAATHDAILLLKQAIESVGDNPEKVHDWLVKNVKNWNGFMGTFSLDEKGNSDLGFVIKVVRNGEFVPVE